MVVEMLATERASAEIRVGVKRNLVMNSTSQPRESLNNYPSIAQYFSLHHMLIKVP